jgi:hypothetical protein
MNKIPMISTGSHRYEGKWLGNGDPFDALNEQDAEELRLIGFAKRAPVYQTRAMVAETPAASNDASPRTTALDTAPTETAETSEAPAGTSSQRAKPAARSYKRREMNGRA